jgi:hypothetical protein
MLRLLQHDRHIVQIRQQVQQDLFTIRLLHLLVQPRHLNIQPSVRSHYVPLLFRIYRLNVL